MNYGIMIRISNNQKKDLINSDIIINIDFPKEILKKYILPNKCIFLNLNEPYDINLKKFCGININNYTLNIPKDYRVKGFRDELIYESFIYNKSIDCVKEQILKDNITIKELIGKNGVINKNEFMELITWQIANTNVILRNYIKNKRSNVDMEEKEVLLTQEGYDNLEKELEYLKTEKRTEISERIKVALGFGDLSENSEYDEAKNAQASNEIKIAELENKLRYARIIDESEIDTKSVQVGNRVTILDLEYNEELEYTIVGSTEVDLSQNKISNESPIGAALMGAKKNQIVEAQTPGGIVKYKVVNIKK